jgi:hypothetical protein
MSKVLSRVAVADGIRFLPKPAMLNRKPQLGYLLHWRSVSEAGLLPQAFFIIRICLSLAVKTWS